MSDSDWAALQALKVLKTPEEIEAMKRAAEATRLRVVEEMALLQTRGGK